MQHLNKDALVDKLCERLAVETAGVELYEALVAKMPDEAIAKRMRHFMQDEARHRDLLAAYLDKLGAHEHHSPSLRLAELEGQAYLKLAHEAETAAQLMNVLLSFELVDENGWEMLIDLGRDLGDEDMTRTFQAALKDEKEHLRGARGMLAQLVRATMTVDETLIEVTNK